MCMREAPSGHPDWDRLYEIASSQDGMFTTKQAAEAGYSPQLLVHYVRIGRASRVHRGVYRLVHFPPGEHEELALAWLWSERAAVISHQSALALHDVSDALPAHVHITLPSSWRRRRFRVPPGVVLHYGDVPSSARTWFGAVPTTNAARTLNDCAREGLSPELLRHAVRQALQRGLVMKTQLRAVSAALRAFGGLE